MATYLMVSSHKFDNGKCPPEMHLIDAISGKWATLVVYMLSEKTMRHSELQRLIGGISQKVLTQDAPQPGTRWSRNTHRLPGCPSASLVFAHASRPFTCRRSV